MAGEVDIRNSPNLSGMSKLDFRYVVEVMQNHLRRDLDLTGLISTMKKANLINDEEFMVLKRNIPEIEVQQSKFIAQILCYLSFEQLTTVLEQEGYRDISLALKSKRGDRLYMSPPRAEIQQSKRTHDYYKNIKSCVDNDAFKFGREPQLRKFIQEQDDKIVSTQLPLCDRQFALEKKAAATVLLIQQHKNYYDRKNILEQAIRMETNGIENTSIEIIYHSKMALTEAQAGNIHKAEDHILQTQILCASHGPCFALTSAFHDIAYTYKIMYFMKPSEERLEKVLAEGDIAIQSLREEKEDIQNLWKRILLLFMVLSLLSITADFDVSDVGKIKKIHKMRANHIVREIKRCSTDIELRRRMILCLCLAVLKEESDIHTAETYASESLDAAEKGGCFRDVEMQNIRTYLRKIRSKQQFKPGDIRRNAMLCLFCLVIYLVACTWSENDSSGIIIGMAIGAVLSAILCSKK